MSKLSAFGIVATTIYFSFGSVLIYLRFNEFSSMAPNEWADFIAGSLGPLALFWLILGFFQQGKELKSSVAALNLQVEETRNSVEQHKIIAQSTQDSYQADMELRKRQVEIDEIARSPRFVITTRVSDLYWDKDVLEISAKNVGTHADSVKITAEANTATQNNIDVSHFTGVETGGTIIISVQKEIAKVRGVFFIESENYSGFSHKQVYSIEPASIELVSSERGLSKTRL